MNGGSMLRDARRSRGMSQAALARASGVPRRTIQNWEIRGVEHATVGGLLKVCRALGCSLDDVAKESDGNHE